MKKARRRARKGSNHRGNGAFFKAAHSAAWQALYEKLFEQAAKEFDDPETERAVEKAFIPVFELVLKHLRSKTRP